jgi:hypothetical protein
MKKLSSTPSGRMGKDPREERRDKMHSIMATSLTPLVHALRLDQYQQYKPTRRENQALGLTTHRASSRPKQQNSSAKFTFLNLYFGTPRQTLTHKN